METLARIDPLLSTADAASFYQIPEATLTLWRAQRKGPRFYRVGRHVRYRREDLEEWLGEQANARRGAPAP